MHIVLRSSRARGDWSFRRNQNQKRIFQILQKFGRKHGVKILSHANVGNHLHLHIHLGSRASYKPFIRAITAAIMMAVTGRSRWSKSEDRSSNTYTAHEPKARRAQASNVVNKEESTVLQERQAPKRFWDYRPFTRIISSWRARLNLRDYIQINQLEGFGHSREQARFYVLWEKYAAGSS